MRSLSLILPLVVFLLTYAAVSRAFDCDGTVFDDDDVYECDDGECILRGFRCNGRDDCADGSDEGAENCGDVIAGAVVGGVAGIFICCVCPCLIVGLALWRHNKIQSRPVLQPTSISQTTTYQHYVPPTAIVNHQQVDASKMYIPFASSTVSSSSAA